MYNFSFPIRGLHFDSKTGCLLKLDFLGYISRSSCYQGRRKLEKDEILSIYPSR